jgi:hypothetical protein
LWLVFLDYVLTVISDRYFDHYHHIHPYRTKMIICLSPRLLFNAVSTSEVVKCLMRCGTVNLHDE